MIGEMHVPLSSFELMVAGGALLIFAGFLLALTGKTRVEVEASTVTSELIVCLVRIAEGLEGMRARSQEEVTRDVLVRLHEIANAKPVGKIREMPGAFVKR
jgi:hypothetical protein